MRKIGNKVILLQGQTPQPNHLCQSKGLNCFWFAAPIVAFLLACVYVMFPFYKYTRINLMMRQQKSIKGNQQLLNVLNQITKFPYIGAAYYDQKIIELGTLKKWKQMTQEAEKALQYNQNKNIFSIWYHWALGHCFLQEFTKCKNVSLQAYSKIHEEEEYQFLTDIYSILISNGIMHAQELPKPFKKMPFPKSKRANNRKQISLL